MAKAKCCRPSFVCSVSPDPEHSDPITTCKSIISRHNKTAKTGDNTEKTMGWGVQLTDGAKEEEKRARER